MPKFFADKCNIFESSIRITGQNANHIKNVLRLKCGERLLIGDSDRSDFLVSISKIEKDSVWTDIIEKIEIQAESIVNVTLYQGLPKFDKMELIIQKCVELGVSKVIPVITERTVVKIPNKNEAQKKAKRWQKISLEASKQSNRGRVPVISEPTLFKDIFDDFKQFDCILMAYEKECLVSLKSFFVKIGHEMKNLAFLIGPEGGFTENEVSLAKTKGAKTVSLGPRILRTETAAINVLSIIMYELEAI